MSYCQERGLDTSREELEQLEKLGLFYPFARVRYAKLKIKVNTLPNGTVQELGVLKDSEEWNGELREENAYFSFHKDTAIAYLEEGLLWEPSTRPFQPWKEFLGENYRALVDSYYTSFQIFTLYHIKMRTTISLGLHWWPPYTDKPIEERGKEFSEVAISTIEGLKKGGWAKEAPII